MDGIIEPPQQDNQVYGTQHQVQTTPQAHAMHQAMQLQKTYATKAFKMIGFFIILGMLFSFAVSFFAFQSVNKQMDDAFEKSLEMQGMIELQVQDQLAEQGIEY